MDTIYKRCLWSVLACADPGFLEVGDTSKILSIWDGVSEENLIHKFESQNQIWATKLYGHGDLKKGSAVNMQ